MLSLIHNSHNASKNSFPESGSKSSIWEPEPDIGLKSPPPHRLEKEKVADQADVDLTQVVSRSAHLEGMVEDTNQAVHTIKQLLERMVIPPAQVTTRLQFVVEGLCVKQQVAKATTSGNATSTHYVNS